MQNLAMYTLLFELPQVLGAVFALDAASTGRLLVSMMVATVATSLVAGRLVDRFGSRPVAVAGSLTCLAGRGVLASAGLAAPAEVRLPLVVLGIGIGLATPAAQSASRRAARAAPVGSV